MTDETTERLADELIERDASAIASAVSERVLRSGIADRDYIAAVIADEKQRFYAAQSRN